MNAAQVDVVERTTQLLTRFNFSTAATELGDLGLDIEGTTNGFATGVNDAGTTVGYITKYVDGISKGQRAVRWDASGSIATELGNLGVDSNGFTTTYA